MAERVRQLCKSEEGSVVTIVALCMVVLLGMTALVTDVGLVYLKENRLASAVDAAALAGAQELPHNPGQAVAVARQYAELNGINEDDITVTLAPDNKALTVSGTEEVNMVLARVLGFNSRQVAAASTGSVGAIRKMTGVMPLAVQQRPPEDPFVFDQEYELKTSGDTGWFGFMALGGTGNAVLEDNLAAGYEGQLAVGDTVITEPGNKSSATSMLKAKVNACPHYPKCTPAGYTLPCPKVITVMVIDGPAKGGRSDSVITGFAMFMLTDSYDDKGSDKVVSGAFLREVTTGEIDPDSNGFGLYGVKLSQ